MRNYGQETLKLEKRFKFTKGNFSKSFSHCTAEILDPKVQTELDNIAGFEVDRITFGCLGNDFTTIMLKGKQKGQSFPFIKNKDFFTKSELEEAKSACRGSHNSGYDWETGLKKENRFFKNNSYDPEKDEEREKIRMATLKKLENTIHSKLLKGEDVSEEERKIKELRKQLDLDTRPSKDIKVRNLERIGARARNSKNEDLALKAFKKVYKELHNLSDEEFEKRFGRKKQ